MKEEDKSNNKKPRVRVSVSKSDKNPKDEHELVPTDFNNISKENLIKMFEASIEHIAELTNKLNELKGSYSLSLIKAKQDLEINAQEVERKKLFTLFDIVTNTKELLVQRVTEMGISQYQHDVDKDVVTVANDTIKLALEQVNTWMKKNNINTVKQLNYETENKTDFTIPNKFTTDKSKL